ncbi:MAG: translation elongation factor Ts [Clostridia bacterium]|nr:translation elongation factor Ts [Clostridia bacterium]
MAEFTAKDVQALRQRTGCGMMDCKKALEQSNGNMDKAIEILREKGKATAVKRADKIASEGVIESYIHMNSRIGVIVELNCETDFVAKSAQFKELAHNICLQIATMNPLYIKPEDVPAEVLEHEKQIFTAQALNEGKPAAVVEKMIVGRINKYYKEVCVLEQEYFRDSNMTIKQLIEEAIGKIGEKITLRRFVRYEVGEGLEKKTNNFAEEIAAEVSKMTNK